MCKNTNSCTFLFQDRNWRPKCKPGKTLNLDERVDGEMRRKMRNMQRELEVIQVQVGCTSALKPDNWICKMISPQGVWHHFAVCCALLESVFKKNKNYLNLLVNTVSQLLQQQSHTTAFCFEAFPKLSQSGFSSILPSYCKPLQCHYCSQQSAAIATGSTLLK